MKGARPDRMLDFNKKTVAEVRHFQTKVLVMSNLHLDRPDLMLTYLVASVLGSISMHYVAMRFFEKKGTNRVVS